MVIVSASCSIISTSIITGLNFVLDNATFPPGTPIYGLVFGLYDGEVDGVNYFFLTKEQFLKNVEEDKFLEHAQFAGNHYGTKKKYIKQKFEEGYNIILEIETQGALQVKEKMPEAVLIFIAPPGVDTVTGDISGGLTELEKRLRGRHTEDDETIKKRLAEAKVELERSKKYDYVVINDDLERAIGEVESITKKELFKNA